MPLHPATQEMIRRVEALSGKPVHVMEDASIPAAYQPFNKATKDGRKMEAYSDLLSAAIRSMIDLKAEKDIESLFTGGRTTALLDTITGIEDFELIAFIVVQEVAS